MSRAKVRVSRNGKRQTLTGSSTRASTGSKTKISAHSSIALQETENVDNYLAKLQNQLKTSAIMNKMREARTKLDTHIEPQFRSEFYFFAACLLLVYFVLIFSK